MKGNWEEMEDQLGIGENQHGDGKEGKYDMREGEGEEKSQRKRREISGEM